MTSHQSILATVLAWLRAGYPHGVPREDYVALFAVLHRKLTEQEVNEIVDELVRDGTAAEVQRVDIEAAIARLAYEKPSQDDVTRVASRLAAGGWPLAHPSDA
ncbi:DUF3349 domain-containing protein [Nocardia pseudobrasiliensis]|uniref:Uncharacterized protein DUF3349 n=1 Tax=Nocardia pseudobrasiliensis TaxID=45979 RepID=A0A370IAI7_9NOCA|nr:DUF3349 domain-containing protein [Nocardia pseudobrasiliensis]RDI67698.1 uncharacterized protein DUF3349 [Nocardia pseudobrasiliensis]